jgi:hypothetical protein
MGWAVQKWSGVVATARYGGEVRKAWIMISGCQGRQGTG